MTRVFPFYPHRSHCRYFSFGTMIVCISEMDSCLGHPRLARQHWPKSKASRRARRYLWVGRIVGALYRYSMMYICIIVNAAAANYELLSSWGGTPPTPPEKWILVNYFLSQSFHKMVISLTKLSKISSCNLQQICPTRLSLKWSSPPD